MSKYGFEKGFGQLKVGDAAKVKAEIMEALGITSRPAWGRRLKGEQEPKISEYQKIEKIFRKYGVKNIWG